MKSIEIRNLDDGLNPLKVGDFTLPIEIANNDIRINAKTEFTKDITTNSNINLIGDLSDLVFNRNVKLESNSTDDFLTVHADQILLNTTSFSDNSSQIRLVSTSGTDQTVTFAEGPTVHFGIGNDGSEVTPTFKIVGNGGVMGTNDLVSITNIGVLTAESSIISGRDVIVPRTIEMSSGRTINWDSGNDGMYSDSTSTCFYRNGDIMFQVADTEIKSDVPLKIKESASAIIDSAAHGQLWVKNETPNELYFTTDAGDDIQITDGTSIAGGGGGGTDTWSKTIGGYKINNNSSSLYYTQSNPNYLLWTSVDSSPTSVTPLTCIRGGAFTADKAGSITNIRINFYALDTGLTDPVKFYVYKYTPSNGDTSVSGTLIATSDTITPVSSQLMVQSKDFSSSNTFSEGDVLLVWLKKDSTSGNQDQYLNVTISGEYS